MRDLTPPTTPGNVKGVLQAGQLVIQWKASTDNSGFVAGYDVNADGSALTSVGGGTLQATIGAFDPTDTRTFTVDASDLAGNVSAPSAQLRAVPAIVGLTVADAKAALTARGFTVGSVTNVNSSATPGTVVGPANLVLAQVGSAIPLQVAVASGGATSGTNSGGSGDSGSGTPASGGNGGGGPTSGGTPSQTKFVFEVVNGKTFSWKQRSYIGARIKTTRAASVTAALLTSGGQRLYRWRLTVKAGTHVVKLPMPRQVRRPAAYRLVWTAVSGTDTYRKTVTLRIVGSTKGLGRVVSPTTTPVEVVLTGTQTPQDASLGTTARAVELGGVRIVGGDPDETFRAVASRGADVRVVVVDVDRYGVQLVRDLRTVFPGLKVIAVAQGPRTRAAATKAGATVAVPASTSAAALRALAVRLATRP
jgi:hypothetical protein